MKKVRKAKLDSTNILKFSKSSSKIASPKQKHVVKKNQFLPSTTTYPSSMTQSQIMSKSRGVKNTINKSNSTMGFK